MQRMSYTEKKASKRSMPLNAPNLRFKLFFYFYKKGCIKLQKVGNTINYVELSPHFVITLNIKTLNALTHSPHPQPSGKPFGLMVNVE